MTTPTPASASTLPQPAAFEPGPAPRLPQTLHLLPETWQVRLPMFEGPLDLLLDLLRVQKLAIVDIPVAQVCDQFHAYLAQMEALNLDIAGEYIYMAAYLIHLKSKMLLPRTPRRRAGQDDDEGDPREELIRRLLEYQRIKEAAQTLAEVDSVRRGLFVRRSDELRRIVRDAEPAAYDLSDLSLFDLLRTFKDVLDRFARENPPPMMVAGETFSVRGQIERLLDALQPGRTRELVDDLRGLSGRREAVAALLAVLEMVRMGLVRLHRTEAGALLLSRTERTIAAEELEAIQS
ncbi:MAG: segregation/condensation protein A [Acidobacteriota bacterium]